MRYIVFILIFLTACFGAVAQQKLYDPSIDGYGQLQQAVDSASQTGKHVLVQVGGNWCPWCIRFHEFCRQVPQIDSIIHAQYIYVPLNYSRENKNEKALEWLEYPQRFGFPVLVVLDSKGRRIHTQDSGLLEKEKSYDTTKVVNFLKNWTSTAIKPR